MQICRVVGTVVSSHKNDKLEGAKLLLVQPETPRGEARGDSDVDVYVEFEARGGQILAIDSVGAGVGERVLVVIEGKAAGAALGRKAAAVDAAIIGIVDSLECGDDA